MQPPLPFPDAEGATPATATPAIVLVRHRCARRYILRVLPDGTLRVTLPRWGSRREALRFVDDSREWVARQRAAQAGEAAAACRWRVGAAVLVDGEPAVLRVEQRPDGMRLWCGEAHVPLQGPCDPGDLRGPVTRWLRARARRELPAALRALAAQHGLRVRRVSVRNQRSRWGACSRQGSITLNWRLVQVPPDVREYVLLHELMHLRELSHSSRFWRLVARVCPHFQQARRWLREEGTRLF